MVSKTRERLIEVARQLFAYKGVENTTMNDIAAASDKGRRTIYTYFKNKREIYNAVIEQQGNQIVDRLRAIVNDDSIDCISKLRKYLLELFAIISQQAPKAEGYKRLILRDHRRLNKIYKVALDKEHQLFAELLRQGVEANEFSPTQAQYLPAIITSAIGSIYYYHAEQETENNGLSQQAYFQQITEFVVNGIAANPLENQHKLKE